MERVECPKVGLNTNPEFGFSCSFVNKTQMGGRNEIRSTVSRFSFPVLPFLFMVRLVRTQRTLNPGTVCTKINGQGGIDIEMQCRTLETKRNFLVGRRSMATKSDRVWLEMDIDASACGASAGIVHNNVVHGCRSERDTKKYRGIKFCAILL
jgi:hypothetical protein